MALEQCGVPKERRFSFYDQVHTTGTDIPQTATANAVLTLSADLIFRDYAQAAYRMRGIGKGQKIVLFVIPEVRKLIELESCLIAPLIMRMSCLIAPLIMRMSCLIAPLIRSKSSSSWKAARVEASR